MEGNGTGNGHKPSQDGDGTPPLVPLRPVRAGSSRPPSALLTPEQLLTGCGFGLLAILLAGLFWGWIFWRQLEREKFPAHPPPGTRGTKIRP